MTAAIRAMPLAEGEVCPSEEMRGRGPGGRETGLPEKSRIRQRGCSAAFPVCVSSPAFAGELFLYENQSYCRETCTNITAKVTYELLGVGWGWGVSKGDCCGIPTGGITHHHGTAYPPAASTPAPQTFTGIIAHPGYTPHVIPLYNTNWHACERHLTKTNVKQSKRRAPKIAVLNF